MSTKSYEFTMPLGGRVLAIGGHAHDYAEFVFYGWNKDIRRNTAQRVEVRKGNHSDIRSAVVRISLRSPDAGSARVASSSQASCGQR